MHPPPSTQTNRGALAGAPNSKPLLCTADNNETTRDGQTLSPCQRLFAAAASQLLGGGR